MPWLIRLLRCIIPRKWLSIVLFVLCGSLLVSWAVLASLAEPDSHLTGLGAFKSGHELQMDLEVDNINQWVCFAEGLGLGLGLEEFKPAKKLFVYC